MEAARPFHLKNSIFCAAPRLRRPPDRRRHLRLRGGDRRGRQRRRAAPLVRPRRGPTAPRRGARYARAFYFCGSRRRRWARRRGHAALAGGAGVGVLYLFVCVVLIAAVVAKLSTLKADRMLKHRMREMLRMQARSSYARRAMPHALPRCSRTAHCHASPAYSFRTPLLQLDWEMIKTLYKDGNGIDKLEFVVGMLEPPGAGRGPRRRAVHGAVRRPRRRRLGPPRPRRPPKDGLREPREVRGDQSRGRGGGGHHSSVADDVSHALRGTHKNLAALVGGRAASAPPSAHSGGTAASGGGAKKALGAARRASQAVAAFSRDEKTVLSTAPSNDGWLLAVRSTAKVAPEPPGD